MYFKNINILILHLFIYLFIYFRNNNYLSISADIVAQSQQQLDDIYRTLNKHKLVKVTL